MHRVPIIAVFTALLASAPAPAAVPKGVAKARVTVCTSALEPEARLATFEGDIRMIPDADRVQLKFVLQARERGASRWGRTAAPGFGTWTTADPGISHYVYAKTVRNLLAPASYRAVVHFRWLDAAGHVVARQERTSQACRQADLRPDLVPLSLVVLANPATGTTRYGVPVRNAGRSASGAFTVTLTFGGQRYQLGEVVGLDAGEQRRVEGEAPACVPGEIVTVEVDPENAVDERSEEADALAWTCPEPVR